MNQLKIKNYKLKIDSYRGKDGSKVQGTKVHVQRAKGKGLKKIKKAWFLLAFAFAVLRPHLPLDASIQMKLRPHASSGARTTKRTPA